MGSSLLTPLINEAFCLVSGVLSLQHFGLAGSCSLSLGGWSPNNLARRVLVGGGGRRRFLYADFTRHRDPPVAGRAARRRLSYGVFAADTADQRSVLPGLRRPLAPTFRAGGIVFFIPWRVVAEQSGAARTGWRWWPPPISLCGFHPPPRPAGSGPSRAAAAVRVIHEDVCRAD